MEMLMTGMPAGAEHALELGLVNHVTPDSQAMAKAREIVEGIAAKSILTVAIGKEAFYWLLEMPLGEAYDYASEGMAKGMMVRDAQEGIDPLWGSASQCGPVAEDPGDIRRIALASTLPSVLPSAESAGQRKGACAPPAERETGCATQSIHTRGQRASGRTHPPTEYDTWTPN